jgi:hypothetical protein
MGMRPRPPGRSAAIDGLKSGFVGMFRMHRPQTWNQLVYSGIDRIRAIGRLPTRLLPRSGGRV